MLHLLRRDLYCTLSGFEPHMSIFTETHNLDHLNHPSNPVPTIRSLENGDAQGSDQSDSLSMLQLDMNASNNDKLAWLRTELIGGDVEFDTPFGRRILTYADHSASGRALHYIESFILRNVLPFYGNTHTNDSFVGHRTTKMVHEAAAYIKRCMGGGLDDALLFCGSGTTAAIKRLQEVMGIAVPSTLKERVVKSLRNEERWVVFLGPYEHHSNFLSWHESLAEVVEIGLNDEGLVDMEALRHELELFKYSNRPMLGSFSACSNVTGIYTDTRAIARLLHQYGAFACFDFAASGPCAEIDMRSGDIEGYDAVFLSPHKFVGGPGTPGILLMSKALYQLASSPPSTCGGGTVCFVNSFSNKDTLYYNDIEEREDAGTPPIVPKIRAALAFWVKEFMGYELMDSLEKAYMDGALKRLLSIPNICVLGNTHARRHPILSFLVFTSSSMERKTENRDTEIYMWGEGEKKKNKPLHGRFVAKLLNDLFGIQARGGCACAGPYGHYLLGVNEPLSLALRSAIQKGYEGLKPGWTRVSFSYCMSKEEFEFILASIKFVAEYGERFLPLYHFNWRSGSWTFRKRSNKGNIATNELGLDHLSNLFIKFGSADETIGENEGNMSDNDDRVRNAINKYTSYLERAKCIAYSLPKIPPERKVSEDIDPSLILFQI